MHYVVQIYEEHIPEDELLINEGGPDSLLEDIFIIRPLPDPEDIVDETPEDEVNMESPERTEEDVIDDDDISDLPIEEPGPD